MNPLTIVLILCRIPRVCVTSYGGNEEDLNVILDELAELLEEDTVEFVENYNLSFHNSESTISEGRISCERKRYCVR